MARAMLAKMGALKLTLTEGKVPGWWTRFWKQIRTAVRSTVRRTTCDNEELNGELAGFMQTAYLKQIAKDLAYGRDDRYWPAKMLQKELELLRRRGRGIGARLRQLRSAFESRLAAVPNEVNDLMQMALSVVASFDDDEVDESRPDEVDEWVKDWLERMDIWLWMERTQVETVVLVENSSEQGTSEKDMAETAFVEMVVKV